MYFVMKMTKIYPVHISKQNSLLKGLQIDDRQKNFI